MKRLIINCENGLSPAQYAQTAATIASEFEKDKGERTRVSVRFWLDKNHPDEVLGMAWGRNYSDSGAIYRITYDLTRYRMPYPATPTTS